MRGPPPFSASRIVITRSGTKMIMINRSFSGQRSAGYPSGTRSRMPFARDPVPASRHPLKLSYHSPDLLQCLHMIIHSLFYWLMTPESKYHVDSLFTLISLKRHTRISLLYKYFFGTPHTSKHDKWKSIHEVNILTPEIAPVRQGTEIS